MLTSVRPVVVELKRKLQLKLRASIHETLGSRKTWNCQTVVLSFTGHPDSLCLQSCLCKSHTASVVTSPVKEVEQVNVESQQLDRQRHPAVWLGVGCGVVKGSLCHLSG
jgi:hypothetical protein